MRGQARAGDGRRLDYVTAGEGTRGTVLVHHGTPVAGALYGPHVAEALARGLRMVAYTRPGYAGSDRHEGRSVADCAGDAAAVADELGVERFYVAGWSGGGPHALACAALLSDRVIAAASIAGVAPIDAEGLDWTAGMGQENLNEFAAAQAGPEALTAYLRREAAELAEVTGDDVAAALGDLLSEVDRAVLTGEYADHLAGAVGEGLAPGIDGWFDDDMAFMRGWGFELASIQVPVSVWQGVEDRFVPFSHGEWLAAQVPGARARLRAEEGHLSLTLGRYGDLLDDLVEAGGG